jgi:hypothetical protein
MASAIVSVGAISDEGVGVDPASGCGEGWRETAGFEGTFRSRSMVEERVPKICW